jgi:drug/metabolite transporter (DMT)-like permease
MITAVILWTWYSRVSVTRLLVIPALPRVMLGMIAGGMALLPIIAIVHWGGLAELSFSSTSTDLLLVTWLCVFAVGAGMVYWMMSAERIGVTVAAIHINVVPFYVLILMLLFGGSLLLAQVAGAVLVATGVVLAQVASSSKFSQA